MQVPYEYLYGVDIALKKLRPYANFQLEGNRFTNWSDPTGTEPPTWEEVMAQLELDKQAHDLWLKNNLTL